MPFCLAGGVAALYMSSVGNIRLLCAGKGREAGLLPRALVSLFGKVQGRMYDAMDLKPVMYQDVKELIPSEVQAEEIRRNSLLKEVNRRTAVF